MTVLDNLFPYSKDVEAVLVVQLLRPLPNTGAEEDAIVRDRLAPAKGRDGSNLCQEVSVKKIQDARRKKVGGRGRGGYNGSFVWKGVDGS